MEFEEAGKFIKKKRKSEGFTTQKSFIKALRDADAEINCSESYISLIESGVKSPSVHLLDVMANVLNMTPQEKGELLLIYKRVPNDLEFAVRSNLKESLKTTNVDILKQKYEEDKTKKNFDNLIRALVLEGNQKEALEMLKTAPEFSTNFIDYQDRTAQMAGISGNYDFAVQAFKLALESCPEEYIQTRADFLMKIGICYFARAMKNQYDDPAMSLEYFVTSYDYLGESLKLVSDNIYCLDEYARCSYHIGDTIQFFIKNENDIAVDKSKHEKLSNHFSASMKNNAILHKNSLLENSVKNYFETALNTYKQILSHSEKGDLPEKALKEAVYFHAYTYGKLGRFEEAFLWTNSILILDQNWLTYFLKAGVFILKFEVTGTKEYLDEALNLLHVAMEYEPETVKSLITTEKNRELKALWQLRQNELELLLREEVNV